jgi:uncharacterized membrane protein
MCFEGLIPPLFAFALLDFCIGNTMITVSSGIRCTTTYKSERQHKGKRDKDYFFHFLVFRDKRYKERNPMRNG